jgi:hypothetical protein
MESKEGRQQGIYQSTWSIEIWRKSRAELRTARSTLRRGTWLFRLRRTDGAGKRLTRWGRVGNEGVSDVGTIYATDERAHLTG